MSRIKTISRLQRSEAAPKCPYLVLQGERGGRRPSPSFNHRCSAIDARLWRPSTRQQATACLTSGFVDCVRFVAAFGSLPLSDAESQPPASNSSEPDGPLKWIGVGALGCALGIAISVAAFVLLPNSQGMTGNGVESAVVAQAASPTASAPTSEVRALSWHHYPTEAEQEAEIQRILSRVEPTAPATEPENAEPEPQPEPAIVAAPSVAFASGDPAAPEEQTHLVADGETLWGIAAENGVDARDLAARNGLPEDALIAVGDSLVIPAPTTDQPTP